MSVQRHIPRTKTGTFYSNAGTALGWSGGASIGVKLANPKQTVVNLTGDGAFLFSVPSTCIGCREDTKHHF